VNTNLEQISDWLTKILVGVGLTQLTELPTLLRVLGESVTVANSVAVTIGLIVTFLICGFFAGYLLTRLFLAGAFQEAENWLSRQAEKASILSEAGAHDKAADALEKAVSAITPDTPKAQKKRIYEELIFNALYEPAPDGFRKAIRFGQQYNAEEPQEPSALIWAYLTAAYGQQYQHELNGGKAAADVGEIRSAALAAARRAIAIDSRVKSLLNSLWDPNAAKSPGDDDLEVFHQDAEFKELLG
jgi:tetratricopeptide (TPR) repeat protein